MKKRVLLLFVILLIIIVGCFSLKTDGANADGLSDNIEEGLDNIDLSELERFYNENVETDEDGFRETVRKLLEGRYDFNYDNIAEYLLKLILNDVFEMLPAFFGVIAISIVCVIINILKGSFFDNGIAEIIAYVCAMCVILLLSSKLIAIWLNAKNSIQNVAILSEIMSPIMLTLMIASGGTVSATVYKPAVLFLTNGIINIILNVVFPLVGLIIIISIADSFSKNVKLSGFSSTAASAVKWIVGLAFTVYGLFVSVQGITSASFDGVSLKAAKYAVSNGIPIIGGYLRDGFDLIVAGSVLIKNAVGVAGVFTLFFIVVVPVIHMAVISVLLKLTAAFTEAIADNATSRLCSDFSKGITYISVTTLAVGFMMLVTVVLMIISVNNIF